MASGGRLKQRGERLVGADGSPPVIHRARMMVREASGRASVNLGGIAEVFETLLSQQWGRSVFLHSAPSASRNSYLGGTKHERQDNHLFGLDRRCL